MTDRFIIDDAGTLIDIQTRNTYDYVNDVCPLLNELDNDKRHAMRALTNGNKLSSKEIYFLLDKAVEQSVELELENERIKHIITDAYNTERTDLGRSVLKQLMEAIQ